MANEPNTPDHRWYERRNNIALSNEDLSRETIFDSGIQKINSWINSQPWGFDYPQLVLDFDDEYYRVDGGDTTFANAITHTRASTATYVDSTGTLQTAAINEPRLGHHVWNGSAWVNEGLLHESEARTNLLVRSEVIDGAGWTDTASTSTNLTDNALGVFDGVSIASNGASFNRLVVSNNPTVTSGTIYTFSCLVKQGTSGKLRFTFRNSAGGTESNINGVFGSLVATASAAGSLELISERIFATDITEVSVRFTPNFSDSVSIGIGPDSNVAGETVIAYAAQLELGPTPSSYIPTAGSTVTRAADVLTVPAANLPWNPLAVSIQMDGRVTYADENSTSNGTFFLWQQDANNTINYRLRTNLGTGEVQFNQIASGVLDERRSDSSEYAPDVLVPFSIAGRHGSTFINGAVDGTALTANTTPVALPNLSATNLLLGNNYNGTIRTFRMWGQDITDAGLVEATT